jgi:mercuric ion binding protein
MIHILRSLALGLSLIVLAGAALAAPPAYKLRVDGLACPFCAYGIEKQLSKLEGVARIDVDIAKGAVTVKLNEGATLDEAAAKAAVKRAGFTLRAFEQVEDAGAKN